MVVVECRARVRLGGRDFFSTRQLCKKIGASAMRISIIRGKRPVNSSFATRSEKLQFVPSNRPRLGVNALEPLPSYIGWRDEPRASVDRASSRARVRDPRISRDRLDVDDARRDSLRPRACRARPRRECVSGGSIHRVSICACRVVDPPRALSSRDMGCGHPFPRSCVPHARTRPTPRDRSRVSCATARAPFAAVNSRIPRRRRATSSRLRPHPLLHRRAPGRVRRPRQRLLPLPRRVPTPPLRACARARGPRRARVDLDHDPRRRFWAPTGPLRLRGEPRGGVPRVAPHHSRLDPRRDAHARRGGFQHLLHRPLRPRRSAARPVDLEPIGVGSARGVVRAHTTRRGRGSRRIASRSRAVSTRAPTRARPIDRSSTRRDRARPATGRRTSMANGSTETRVGTGRTESPTRTGDAKSRANASTARPPPRRERAEAGYYPASYRVALPSGGRDTTASCALRAASRRAEASPTVRAAPVTRGASSHDCCADEREDAIGARETRGTRSSGRGETRETWVRRERRRRTSRARSEVRAAAARRATGTSRPTSHLPERFGAGFGGAARRWAR